MYKFEHISALSLAKNKQYVIRATVKGNKCSEIHFFFLT